MVRVLLGCVVKSQLQLKIGQSLAACCSVHARVAPNLCKACGSCNQSWQQLLCRTLARLPVAALLTTPHISAWWFAGYLSSYILLMFSCVAVQLVATYHCDQAYAFDVSGTGSCATAYGTTPDSSGAEPGMASDASASDRDAPTDDCMPSTSSIRQVLQHLSLL